MMCAVNRVAEVVGEIGARWKRDFLLPAKGHDKANPAGQDYEDYSKHLIAAAEMLRQQPEFRSLAHHVYLVAVEMADKHCAEKGIDLHRGALDANLAITYFERR